MNRKVKNLISWIVYIIILIALVWGVPKGLAYVLDTEYPMASITSGSMWPTLKKGDLVLVKGVDGKEDIRVGDIVVYKNEKGFTIHRVERLKTNTLITKGDANKFSDEPVEYEDIIGRALTIKDKTIKIPYLGGAGVLFQKIYGNAKE